MKFIVNAVLLALASGVIAAPVVIGTVNERDAEADANPNPSIKY